MSYCFFARIAIGKGPGDLREAGAVTVVFFYENAVIGKSLFHYGPFGYQLPTEIIINYFIIRNESVNKYY